VFLISGVAWLMNEENWFAFFRLGLIGIIGALLPTGPIGSVLVALTIYGFNRTSRGGKYLQNSAVSSFAFVAICSFFGLSMIAWLSSDGDHTNSSRLLSVLTFDRSWVDESTSGIVTRQGSRLTPNGILYYSTIFFLQFVAYFLAMFTSLKVRALVM
jgi:hypothetical protein